MRRSARAGLSGVLMVAAASMWGQGLHAAESNPNIERELVGKISYTVRDTGEYRGEEDWRLTIHPDGSRTIRMTNPIKATNILRDVILRVDGNYRPLHAQISHWEGGKHRGAAFYWTQGDYMHAVASAPNGTLEQTVKVPEKFSIGSRPQGPFSWHAAHYDLAKRGVQRSTAYIMDRVGTSVGSILGSVRSIDVELVGEEKLTVGAGTFDTWKFKIENELDLWVDKKEFITVLLVSREVEPAMKYELVELKEKVLGK